jgi:uncharacterized Fe-S cluster protein YjdI
MLKKEYANQDITVVWKPDICIHSEICARGLPKVFDPGRKPWIDIDQASSKDIVAQVNQCPSGALSIKSTGVTTTEETRAKVQLMAGGPLILKGTCEIVDEEGNTQQRKNASFCRCTKSANFPYCDGSHKG